MKIRKFLMAPAISALLLAAAGCTTINRSHKVILPAYAEVAIMPFANHTATAQANAKAASILSHLLQARGVRVDDYHAYCNSSATCRDAIRRERAAKAWARRRHIKYALFGSVNEWRYKVGLDGEPVVSLSMDIKYLPNNRIVWSAVGSKVGSSRASLGNTAQTLIGTMLGNVKWR